MLAKRIIPCLDIDKGRVVKGVNFVGIRDAGDAIENAVFYDNEGADELIFLDITATHEKREILSELVEKIAANIFIPFTVGGGIRTIDDIKTILRKGADKVSMNSAAVKNPDLINQGAGMFGSQCIVLAIDAKKTDNQKYNVFVRGGRKDTGIDAVEWAREAEDRGAGEILLTSMDCDGTKGGFDNELTRIISSKLSIPVIASGGAGEISHFYDTFKEGNADAALAASIFHFREYSIPQVKEYLKEKNIPVRI